MPGPGLKLCPPLAHARPPLDGGPIWPGGMGEDGPALACPLWPGPLWPEALPGLAPGAGGRPPNLPGQSFRKSGPPERPDSGPWKATPGPGLHKPPLPPADGARIAAHEGPGGPFPGGLFFVFSDWPP